MTTLLQCVAVCCSWLHDPPDPINDVLSLTGKYISKMYFTYCPVQIYKIMFRKFLFSRIWSSAQDYAVLGLLLNPVVFWISTWQNLSGGNVRWKWFVLAVFQFWKGISAVPALQYFTWFIGAGGLYDWDSRHDNRDIVTFAEQHQGFYSPPVFLPLICIHYTYVYTCMCICVYVYMCICVYAYMCICIYMHMCICVYVYMCICIWTISRAACTHSDHYI